MINIGVKTKWLCLLPLLLNLLLLIIVTKIYNLLEEKGTTEDKRVGWHHQLKGHEFEQALEDGEGQGRLACCNR